MLELLLRRMSDPGQIAELVSRIPPHSETGDNPFVIAVPEATGGFSSAGEDVFTGDGDGAKTVADASNVVPAPSAIELQCLLLAVATSEGVSKIQALGQRGAQGGGDVGEGNASGGGGRLEGGAVRGRVGNAAVEMLGRLTNDLLSGYEVKSFCLLFFAVSCRCVCYCGRFVVAADERPLYNLMSTAIRPFQHTYCGRPLAFFVFLCRRLLVAIQNCRRGGLVFCVPWFCRPCPVYSQSVPPFGV